MSTCPICTDETCVNCLDKARRVSDRPDGLYYARLKGIHYNDQNGRPSMFPVLFEAPKSIEVIGYGYVATSDDIVEWGERIPDNDELRGLKQSKSTLEDLKVALRRPGTDVGYYEWARHLRDVYEETHKLVDLRDGLTEALRSVPCGDGSLVSQVKWLAEKVANSPSDLDSARGFYALRDIAAVRALASQQADELCELRNKLDEAYRQLRNLEHPT